MSSPIPVKAGLHPRNRHRAGYDFARLVEAYPTLAPFVGPNAYGNVSINFADPAAVKALNRALLAVDYGVAAWDVPPGYLCPPIPGRADYVHHLADLLGEGTGGVIPREPGVAILDLGVGANCIYPVIGAVEYGWRFVGTETDAVAGENARKIAVENPVLHGRVEIRRQPGPLAVLRGVVGPGERFAAAMCNPPFHASEAEAAAGNRRKQRNLSGGTAEDAPLNFGGRRTELWCQGGELGFIRRMVAESAQFPTACGWFTVLVSKATHLGSIEQMLIDAGTNDARVLPMAQGQKQSRIVAWRFAR